MSSITKEQSLCKMEIGSQNGERYLLLVIHEQDYSCIYTLVSLRIIL